MIHKLKQLFDFTYERVYLKLMKLSQILPLFLITFSMATFAKNEAIEIDSEKEILRELDQIHTMGSTQWSKKLEEARENSSEIEKTHILPVRLTESLWPN